MISLKIVKNQLTMAISDNTQHSGLELVILTIISKMANFEASTGHDCQKGLKSASFDQFDTDSY